MRHSDRKDGKAGNLTLSLVPAWKLAQLDLRDQVRLVGGLHVQEAALD
jgi:hypothetical protein